jgi:hypothetical protein
VRGAIRHRLAATFPIRPSLTRAVSVADIIDRPASIDSFDARAEARFAASRTDRPDRRAHSGRALRTVRRQSRSRQSLPDARRIAQSIQRTVCRPGTRLLLRFRRHGMPQHTRDALRRTSRSSAVPRFVQRMDPRSRTSGRTVTDASLEHAALIPARLHWQGDQPFSRQFGDIYHAPDGARCSGSHRTTTPRRTFRARRGVFTVGELGFGTALNFAVIAHARRAPFDAQLTSSRLEAPHYTA